MREHHRPSPQTLPGRLLPARRRTRRVLAGVAALAVTAPMAAVAALAPTAAADGPSEPAGPVPDGTDVAASLETPPLSLTTPGQTQSPSGPYDALGTYVGPGGLRPAPQAVPSAEGESEHRWDWQHPLPQGNSLTDVDFVDAQTGWAVGYNATILHTTDGGANWEIQSQGGVGGLPPGSVADNSRFDAVEFVDADTGWVAGGASQGRTTTSQGVILRTDDGGQTWTPQEFDASNGFGAVHDIHFVDENHGWAVGRCCDASTSSNFSGPLLLRTTNGGQDWENLSSAPGLPTPEGRGHEHVFFVDEQRGYLVSPWEGNVVFRTDDGGETWTNVTNNLGTRCVPTSVYFTSATDGYLTACGAGQFANIVWRTADGGDSWTPHSSTLVFNSLADIEFTTADHGFAVGGGVLIHTTDAGETWSVRGRWEPGWGAALSVAGDGQTITAVGGLGGIVRSEDGGQSWADQISYLTLGSLSAVSFADAATGIAVGAPDALGGDPDRPVILRTTDGTSWEQLDPGVSGVGLSDVKMINTNIAVAVGTKTSDFLICDDGKRHRRSTALILRTTDGGQSWVDQSPQADPDPCAPTIPGLSGVHFVDADTGWAVGWSQPDGRRILHTIDGGATWTEQDDGLDTEGWLEDVFFVDENLGWAVGGAGTEAPGLIFRTTDGGQTWEDQSQSTWLTGHEAVFFVDENTGWVTGDGGSFQDPSLQSADILHTTDGGQTWTNQADGRAASLEDISFADANTGIAVGVNGLILRTTDGGTNWAYDASLAAGAPPSRTTGRYFGVDMIDTDTAVAVGTLWNASGEGGSILRRTGDDPGPGPEPEPSEGSQDIVATVPEAPGDGSLVLSVDPTDRTVTLPEMADAGDRLSTSGQLRPVAVTDTRAKVNPGWDASAQVSDFVNAADASVTFDGGYLGWSPTVASHSSGQIVTPGSPVAPGFPDPANAGLSVPQTLATAAQGQGVGTAVLGAGISLEIPTGTPAGTYTAVLTLTAI